MAITHVASTSSFANVGSTTVTTDVPAGVTAGDLLVWVIRNQNATAITAPSGWTEAQQTTQTGLAVVVLYRYAGSSEPASYSATTPSGRQASTMTALRGVHASTVLDATPLGGVTGTGNPAFNEVTTATADAVVLAVCGSTRGSGGSIDVTGTNADGGIVAESATNAGSGTNIGGAVVLEQMPTPGAFTPTVTMNATMTRSSGQVFALKPAAVGGPVSITVDGARSASRTGTPTLAHNTDLTVDGTRAATRTATPTLTHHSAVSVDSTRAATRTGTPVLEQTASLTVNGTRAETRTGVVALDPPPTVTLTVHGARSATRTSSPTVAQTTSLTVASARTETRTGTVDLTAASALTVDGTRAEARIETPLLAQATALTINGARAPTRVSRVTMPGTVTPLPPAERLYRIPADDRTHAIDADTRTYTIPADHRTYTI